MANNMTIIRQETFKKIAPNWELLPSQNSTMALQWVTLSEGLPDTCILTASSSRLCMKSDLVCNYFNTL